MDAPEAWTVWDGLQLGADAARAAQNFLEGNPADAVTPAVNAARRIWGSKTGKLAVASVIAYAVYRWTRKGGRNVHD